MKHTLTLTGSSAALAAAMTAFDAVEAGLGLTDGFIQTAGRAERPAGNAPSASSTTTGTGTTVAPAAPMPSAPTMAAPTPPAPSPAVNTSNDEEDGDDSDGSGLDSDGLPWDDRIHSSSKKKGKDGTWNKRRGGPVGDERTAIEAELRGGGGVEAEPAASTPAAPPPPPMPPLNAPTIPNAPAPIPAPTPAAPPPPMPAPEQPAPVPVEDEMDFTGLMQQIGPKLGEAEGQIDQGYLVGLCQAQGINSITDLAVQPEKIGAVVAQLRADNRW